MVASAGDASATRHVRSIRPRRLEAGHLVENPDTLLAASDLVFVDAVGTGDSRVTRAELAPALYNYTTRCYEGGHMMYLDDGGGDGRGTTDSSPRRVRPRAAIGLMVWQGHERG